MRRLAVSLIIFFSVCTKAQNIDSLLQAAEAAPMDTTKVYLYAYLSNVCDLKDIAGNAKKAIAIADELMKVKGKSPRFYNKVLNCKATAVSNMGFFFDSQGNTKSAMDAYYQAMTLYEQNGNEREASYVLGNIAFEHSVLGETEKATEYYNKALQVQLKMGDKAGASTTIYNMGIMYFDKKEYKRAQEYYTKSLELSQQAGYKRVIAQSLSSLSSVLLVRGDQKKAGEYAWAALQLTRHAGDPFTELNGYVVVGQLLKSKHQYALALRYLDTALSVATEYHSLSSLKRIEEEYYLVYMQMDDAKKSLEHYIKANQYKDSIINDENRKASFKNQFKTDYEKKELEIRAQQERERIVAETKQRQQKFILVGVVLVLVLVAIFAFYVFRSLQENRKQKKLVEEKNHIIEEKQKEIIDSINYAKRIQYTLLAHDEFLLQHLPQHFVYFDPKDIVSGDFYWATEHYGKFYLAVCDSTGHGVPGAFMSLLNIGFLSEAIKEKNIYEPHKVFDHVRKRLTESVSKEGQKDGFDGILVCIDKKSKTITYAAANNAPELVRGETITTLEYDRMPVGIGEKQDHFKLHTITYQPGDLLYLFTDGYADQFGGPKGKKFMYKRLNDLLLANHTRSPQEQLQILKTNFKDWKGNLEQVDDVCIVGIRL